ncbi:MAG: hypothetical protein ACOH2Q_18105 [Rhodococcus sp. (in: high G+C Gram-positive bacteria)]
MTQTDVSGAQALVETPWGGRVIASSFVVLATGLSWVFVATAMINQ